MPRSGQIIPKYSFPHSETYINDYTIRQDDTLNAVSSSSEVTYSMHVFPAPSGEDRVMTTITGGLAQFLSIFGKGSGKIYGQSYMNAYSAAASGAAILQCLRVTPDDATYANAILWAGIREDNGVDTQAVVDYITDGALTESTDADLHYVLNNGKYTLGVYHGKVSTITDVKDAKADDIFEVAENATITIGDKTASGGAIIQAVQKFDYRPVTPAEGANPATSGWFEKSGDDYIPTSDNEVVEGKAYYTACDASDIVIGNAATYKTYHKVSTKKASVKGIDTMYLTTYIRSNDTREVELTEEYLAEKDLDVTYAGTYVIGQLSRDWNILNNFELLYTILEKADSEAGDDDPKYIPNGFSDDVGEGNTLNEVGAPFTYVKIFAVIGAKGRGVYGRNYAVQVQNAYTEDKRNDYKNHNLSVIDLKTLQIIETYPVSFYSNAASGNSSIFVDDVINDVDTGSDYVKIAINSDLYEQMYEVWALAYTKYHYSDVVPYGTADVSNLMDIKELNPDADPEKVFTYKTIEEAYADIPEEMILPINIGEFDGITGLRKGAKGTKGSLHGMTVIEPIAIENPVPNYIATDFTGTVGVSLYDGSDGTFVEIDNTTGILSGSKTKRYNSAGKLVTANGVVEGTVGDTEWKNAVTNYGYATDNTSFMTAIEYKILQGFLGDIDKSIKSKKRFPTTYILDAGYPAPIKQAIWALKEFRTDCVAYFDAGDPSKVFESDEYDSIEADLIEATGYKDEVESLTEVFPEATTYFLPLKGKVKDPVTKKPTWVTYTYRLASLLPSHFLANNGKHVPFAGAVLGKIDGFIRGTVSPVYEDDIDFDELDKYAEYHVNYAKYNADGTISIAMQDTHQDVTSDLSEMNAVLIMLDVKRDCEKLIEQLEYQFNEVSDVIRFNSMLEMDVLPYYSAAQVRSIRGEFARNAWEAERGILHLYIEIANKDLVKTGIIEIDIVQGDSQAQE